VGFFSDFPSQHGTQNVKTHNRTTQKTKKMSNTEPTKKPEVNAGGHGILCSVTDKTEIHPRKPTTIGIFDFFSLFVYV
jgi:hypothetical protein